ncbi:hypothetical protein SAMN05216352_1192 [Alteribacillus bidgolensis]|uniref:Uncharacterized protein n=1 Tax=Alteribacillus bidgolensis TaxID=930129 RepID=A0A1G8QAS0_9BACI|nr:hypothetical protein SAMN05216352_1192 [Alteribacillus bidgolensis]
MSNKFNTIKKTNNKDKLLIFMHIPKTSGGTFCSIIQANYTNTVSWHNNEYLRKIKDTIENSDAFRPCFLWYAPNVFKTGMSTLNWTNI